MTRYELALALLREKGRLDEQVNVRDENGKPTSKFFLTRYNDVVGIYIEGHREGD